MVTALTLYGSFESEMKEYMYCVYLAHRKYSVNEAAQRLERAQQILVTVRKQPTVVNKVRQMVENLKILQRTLGYKTLSFITKKLRTH